jgi:hypothetical protein
MDSNATASIILPPGTTNHGDPNLLCLPATWSDVLSFFAGNYIAHAATVLSIPGQPAFVACLRIISALLFPVSGIRRGILAIFSGAKLAATDLRMAARARALCRVVKLDVYARTFREYSLTEGRKSFYCRLESLNMLISAQLAFSESRSMGVSTFQRATA